MVFDPLLSIDFGVRLQVGPLLGSEQFRCPPLKLGLLFFFWRLGLIL
jgi:hypothetical protein